MEHGDIGDEPTSVEFQFELVDTDDPCTLILVCVSNTPLTPDDYAQALIAYAEQLNHKTSMKDVDRSTMN